MYNSINSAADGDNVSYYHLDELFSMSFFLKV